MKKQIPYWQTVGFLFTAVAGTLLHFLFDWTGGNAVVGLFSAVNESIWEHMKLLFYPMVVYALVEYFCWGKERESFWCIKLLGILLGIGVIPVLYYTYTGVLGVKADWFNITIFFLAAGLVYYVETRLFQRAGACPLGRKLSVFLIVLTAALFTVFTFVPPRIPLFADPVSGTYGLQILQGGHFASRFYNL